jgi:hypothetical protein
MGSGSHMQRDCLDPSSRSKRDPPRLLICVLLSLERLEQLLGFLDGDLALLDHLEDGKLLFL